jgi:hypothetical protein
MSSGQRAFGHVAGFNDVFKQEISVINARRGKKRAPAALQQSGTDSTGEPVLVPSADSNLIGLALSGGGVRSAAFCLGALQALDEAGVIAKADYLSTVSGGGYIGCSLSASLDVSEGDFPFKTTRFEDETPALQHIRDYSNYLFPDGMLDAIHNIAIYARGLVANCILLAPFLLGFAAITIFNYRTFDDLNKPKLFSYDISPYNIFPFRYFVITAYFALILLAIVIVWSLYRSISSVQGEHEVPGSWSSFVGYSAFVLLFCAFCELQPILLSLQPESFTASSTINKIVAALTPVAAIIAMFARQLADLIKTATETSRTRVMLAGYVAKLAIYFAGAIIPLLIWVLYLNLSRAGICPDGNPDCPAPDSWSQLVNALGMKWLDSKFAFVGTLYICIAVLCLLLSLHLRPNANSLHALYRDRLAKAFLFVPQRTLHKEGQLEPLNMRLSQLSGQFGPYHLINTSLNIQNSTTANKRGRNADFFSFSRDFIGSEVTGYVATTDVERTARGLDLASAMAISGAAASSNMGAETIKPLTPTLALLNIRLGYWLRNPMHLKYWKSWNWWANFYIIAEMLGTLNERRTSVYLTDGGHIENLGLYELLKRRCRIIIAVDAEADSELAFGSFNTLVRYARIDLDIEIDLPWEQIREVNRMIGEEMEETGNSKMLEGPHCAIGSITYAGGSKGILVYIKSSLTGDENDYVFHYKKRYPAFPHETTLDQMFSEEQFEAYRALGYHAAFGLFDHRDTFAQLDPRDYPDYESELELLDRKFPRAPGWGPPTRREHFVEWLRQPKPCGRPEGNTPAART